jgi:hypothetical protein
MKKEPTKKEIQNLKDKISQYDGSCISPFSTWEAYKWLSLHPVKKWYQFWK